MKTDALTVALCALFFASLAEGNGDAVYPESPFVTTEAVYVSGTGLSRYERDTLARTWDTLPGLQTFEPVIATNAVLVGSINGLYAFHKKTGSVRWHLPSTLPIFSPIVTGGRVYTGSQDGFVRSIDLADGSVIWERKLEGWMYPPVEHEGVLVVGGSEGILYGLSAQGGDTLWTRQLSQELVYRPVATPGGLALVTTFSAELIAIDTKNGDVVWQAQDPAAGFPPLVIGGRLYMGAFDGTLRVREVRDGLLVWEHRFEDLLPYTPHVVGKTVVIGSENGIVAALNSDTGRLLWRKDLPHTLVTNPVLIDGKVVVVVERGGLLILDDQVVASSNLK